MDGKKKSEFIPIEQQISESVVRTTVSNRPLRNNFFHRNELVIYIVLGMVMGIALGSLAKNKVKPYDYVQLLYIEFPGRLFLNMTKCLALPLLSTSIVSALANLDTAVSRKLGFYTVIYYTVTAFVAVTLGAFLVLTIKPGLRAGDMGGLKNVTTEHIFAAVSLVDMISQFFPDNFVAAATSRVVRKITFGNETNENGNSDASDIQIIAVAQPGTNVLGFITMSIVLGVLLNMVGEETNPLKEVFEAANIITLRITRLILWLTPVGIASLLATKFIETESLLEVGQNLGFFLITVLLGLFMHGCVILPFIYWFVTRKSPLTLSKHMFKATMTAWGTDSSLATLPVTMECLVKRTKLDLNVVRFVVPIGAEVNVDGNALYEAVACIFIAQANNMTLDMEEIIIICLTATVIAIGAASIPNAGQETIAVVLSAAGLPTEHVAYIVAVDWFLDRFRTIMNVWGDSIGAGIFDHYYGKKQDNLSDSSRLVMFPQPKRSSQRKSQEQSRKSGASEVRKSLEQSAVMDSRKSIQVTPSTNIIPVAEQ